MDAALATEKAAAGKYSADSEFIVKKHNDEVAALKEALEVSDEAFMTAQAKANEALEAREREVDGLSNVVKHLKKEMEDLTSDKQQELKDKIAELNLQHEAQVKDAHEKADKIAQEASEKIETITKLHQAQLEQGSGALAVRLQEVEEAAESREAELLEQIEAGKKEAAEAIEAAWKSAAESIEVIKKEAVRTADENHKEWESKIGELKSFYEEQINVMTTESDKSQVEMGELLENIETMKQVAEEGKAVLGQREMESEALKKTLDTLSSDLTVCPLDLEVHC